MSSITSKNNNQLHDSILDFCIQSVLTLCLFLYRYVTGTHFSDFFISEFINMWELICNLPSHLVRDHVVRLLDLHDIVQLDLAVVDAPSRLQLHALLEHFTVAVLESQKLGSQINEALVWLYKRNCKVSLLKLNLDKISPDLSGFPQIDKCEMNVPKTLSSSRIELFHSDIFTNVHKLQLGGDEETAEVLFRKLPNVSSLEVVGSGEGQELLTALQCGWHITSLKLCNLVISLPIVEAIACNGAHLEELALFTTTSVGDPNALLRGLANSCRQLRQILLVQNNTDVVHVNDTGVIALAEHCPLLENVSLSFSSLTDSSVVSLAQHCKRLKRLSVSSGVLLTYRSLLALSECGLPLESLSFPVVPIPEAQLPRCAHALSHIDSLSTPPTLPALRLMTSLTSVNYHLDRHPAPAEAVYAELRAAQCSTLKSLCFNNRISGALLAALVQQNKNLIGVIFSCPVCDEDLALLAPSAKHIKVMFILEECVNVTDAGLLALSEHCWQLQTLYISSCSQVTEAGLARVIEGCHQLTSLDISAACMSQETALRLRAQRRKLHITLKQP